MRINKQLRLLALLSLGVAGTCCAQQKLDVQAADAMLRATKYMVEEVSTNGGYVWYYTPDLSRRWGEMEAYKTMVWVQDAGTVDMGNLFLDAYAATANEYYYGAAEKAAAALVWGQSHEGGWNYMIDFAGDRSLKNWYNTIGKNGWRLEEFQHYYGNDTYDDDVTSNAARFLLRMYLEKLDPKYKPALDKAINFILESQYPAGGWPQRYPLHYDFNKAGHPDYTSFYTFNDDVTWENVNFLIQCYLSLGEQRFLEPVSRGMNFYLLTQQGNGAWAQQYNMQLEPAGARTYEPAALLPRATFANAQLLIRFYEYTGDRKFIARIPDAIKWLEKTRLPAGMTEGGKWSHPLFVEVGTDKPIFVHRKGSNVKFGYYYYDYKDDKLLIHMNGKGKLDIDRLKREYDRVCALQPEELTRRSPLLPQAFTQEGTTPQRLYSQDRGAAFAGEAASDDRVKQLIAELDDKNRWLIKHAMISHPYAGDGKKEQPTDEFASTRVGDETDTSPYIDPSDQLYLSTAAYMRNMQVLMRYVQAAQKRVSKKN